MVNEGSKGKNTDPKNVIILLVTGITPNESLNPTGSSRAMLFERPRQTWRSQANFGFDVSSRGVFVTEVRIFPVNLYKEPEHDLNITGKIQFIYQICNFSGCMVNLPKVYG